MNSFTCLFVVAAFYAVSLPQCYAQETAVDRASTGEPGLASYIRGIASYGQAEYTEAERAFLKTVRLVPEYTGARYWLGMTYFRQNRLDEAEAAFKSLTGTFTGEDAELRSARRRPGGSQVEVAGAAGPCGTAPTSKGPVWPAAYTSTASRAAAGIPR